MQRHLESGLKIAGRFVVIPRNNLFQDPTTRLRWTPQMERMKYLQQGMINARALYRDMSKSPAPLRLLVDQWTCLVLTHTGRSKLRPRTGLEGAEAE
jgi:hypothetical protein